MMITDYLDLRAYACNLERSLLHLDLDSCFVSVGHSVSLA